MKENKRKFGARGEQIACDYLISAGYRILHRNYYTPYGELDIIACDEDYLVFCEVKRRSDTDVQKAYGRPSLAVNYTKRQHIITSARFYMQKEKHYLQPRFDIIEILTPPSDDSAKHAKIEHIQNAFGVN